MIKDPFKIYKIILNLNIYQIKLLIKVLTSCSPDRSEESTVLQLYDELNKILEEIEQQ